MPYFPARLDFPSPPLSAPGSPRMNISKPTTVSEHFLTNDHSANDIALIPLELTKSNRDSVRKAREPYPIERGKTLLGREVLLGIPVGHVPLGSQNSCPISGQKMSFSTPDFNKMCVTSLRSCVVHGPICDRLMGGTVNGLLYIYKSFTVQPTKWP